MTKETTNVALRKESKARGIIAQLGLCRTLKGTHIIKDLITGKKSMELLTDLEIEQIVDSWESRYCIPIVLLDQKKNIDNISLEKKAEETDKDYRRRKVILIGDYIKTMCS